jgi:hypothetical protein
MLVRPSESIGSMGNIVMRAGRAEGLAAVLTSRNDDLWLGLHGAKGASGMAMQAIPTMRPGVLTVHGEQDLTTAGQLVLAATPASNQPIWRC